MKKIIFGLLSLFLISPVFAAPIYPNGFYFSKISVESLLQDQNITYYLYPSPYSNPYPNLYYFSNNNSLYYVSNITKSLNQVDFGPSIDSSSINLINQVGSGFISGNFINGFPVFSFELSGGFPKLGYSSLYLQQSVVANSGNYNGVIAFGSNPVDPLNASVLGSDSFVRFFFNNNIPFTSVAPVYSDFSYNPVGVQVFGSSLYVLTNKAKIYDYSTVKSLSKNWVVSSYLDGYSYTVGDSGHLELHSVLPGFSQFVTGSTFIVPNYLETTEFLMFKGDGYKYNGNHNIIGVITQDLSGDWLYSKYLCDSSALSLTEINGVYKYNFDSACFLMDGGTFSNSNRVYDCGAVYLSLLLSHTSLGDNQSTNCLGGTYRGKDISFYFDDNHNLVVYTYIRGYRVRQSFKFPLTSNSSVDILRDFDNTAVPPEPLTTGKVVDVLDTLCKSSLIKPAFCNGVTEVSTGVDGFWDLDLSGNLIYTLINTDPNNMGWADIASNGSGGFNITCSNQDGFGCPLLENAGLSGYLDYGSGFILGTDYYETFFQKTGRFFACPYGYVVLDTNSFLKILNKFNQISESIGFDFMLPINCSIAAFTHGKNFKFLKDVDLGLNPLMGHIQGPDDPRVYLYRFFDFLMSIALLFFLLKLYHLIF